jgi:hypothetical protein
VAGRGQRFRQRFDDIGETAGLRVRQAFRGNKKYAHDVGGITVLNGWKSVKAARSNE